MKILHIELSKTMQQMMALAAEDLAVTLVQVNSFAEAISQLKEHTFDLLVSCRTIDGREAYDFCTRLRQHDEVTPFLIYTANFNHELQLEASQRGVTETFPKPDLLDKFQEYVARHKRSHQKIDGRVLVIEDSQSQREFLVELLDSQGLVVDSCATVEEALNFISRYFYNVIVSDVFLSNEYTAFDLITQVKRLPHPKSLSFVVAISSMDDPSRRLELLHRGVDMFMSKPLKEMEFTTIIRSFVEKSHKLLSYSVRNAEPEAPKIRPGLKVLYIEDNRVLQILMKTFLQSLPELRIEFSTNGADGIAKMRSFKPDILLLDLNLPDRSGWDIAKELRDDVELSKTQLIAVSGEIMNEQKNQQASELFDGFIAKPFSQPKVIELIRQLQEKH